MSDLIIVAPAFNEGANLSNTLDRLCGGLLNFDYRILVVDDCSTDGTADILADHSSRNPRILVTRNSTNLGHGPSVLRGLAEAYQMPAEVIATVDGDGNFNVHDLAFGVGLLLQSHCEVGEGTRVGRDDPWFRFLTSEASALLARVFTRRPVGDANTPFRIFRRGLIPLLLSETHAEMRVPNLWFTVEVRRRNLCVKSFSIREELHAAERYGVTWRQRTRAVPSLRFIKFVVLATVDLVAHVTRFRRGS